MTALRSRARSRERSARLSGRPLTQVEATAPYVALAETAGERLRAGKSVKLAEKAQEAQEAQFGQTLEETRAARAETARMEAERLAEARRAEQERIRMQEAALAEQKKTRQLEYQAAQAAENRAEKQRTMGYANTGLTALAVAGEYGDELAKGASWLYTFMKGLF